MIEACIVLVNSIAQEFRQTMKEHHRDEEIEHAVMALEWLRRKIPHLDRQLRKFLYAEGPMKERHEGGEDSASAGAHDLGLASMQ